MNTSIRRLKSASGLHGVQPYLLLLCAAHLVVSCLSLIYATDTFPGVVAFDRQHLFAAILGVTAFAPVAVLFAASHFSFGYFVGFYFYTMILGYLWYVNFSLLSYNHQLAVVSIFLSALAFLAPALSITSPIEQLFKLSIRRFEMLLSFILILSAAVVAAGAVYNFTPASFSEMYKFRAQLEFPAALRYAIGITSSAFLPFAFAGFVARKCFWRAGICLLLLLLFYPITLTKLTLFAPAWLLFLLLLSTLAETRTAVILSLFLPISVGVAVFVLAKADAFPSGLGMLYFWTVNSRMVAMPSIALDVYNNFFASHPVTYFCQINLLKPFLACPYDQQLSVMMSKAYELGFFNASLFATEGIASVGPTLAPFSAFVCGLVIALGNRLSSGLPPRFILLSAGILPQVFLNVPLSTNLLTNGAALLFLLWYLTPRALFEENSAPKDTE
jgi:hypothetical protein